MTADRVPPELIEALLWLQGEVKRHHFGAFAIEVAVHDGRVVKVSRTATEVVKPPATGPVHQRGERSNEEPKRVGCRRRS